MAIGRKLEYLRDRKLSACTEVPANSISTRSASSPGRPTAKPSLPGLKMKKPDTRDGSREARILASSSEPVHESRIVSEIPLIVCKPIEEIKAEI